MNKFLKFSLCAIMILAISWAHAQRHQTTYRGQIWTDTTHGWMVINGRNGSLIYRGIIIDSLTKDKENRTCQYSTGLYYWDRRGYLYTRQWTANTEFLPDPPVYLNQLPGSIPDTVRPGVWLPAAGRPRDDIEFLKNGEYCRGCQGLDSLTVHLFYNRPDSCEDDSVLHEWWKYYHTINDWKVYDLWQDKNGYMWGSGRNKGVFMEWPLLGSYPDSWVPHN